MTGVPGVSSAEELSALPPAELAVRLAEAYRLIAEQVLSSVLTFCDMTTSPDGEIVTAERRLAEIQQCYGPGHLVSRSIQRATPMILRSVEQVQDRAARSA
jgi:hypothetical protein